MTEKSHCQLATLYHVPRTISSPLVQCLSELDLIGKVVNVEERQFSDLKQPNFLAINPMGTSPAFQDGPIVLWESGAILDYLLERHDATFRLHPPPITPRSSKCAIVQRAKYLHVKQYIIATVYPFVASLTIHQLKPRSEQDAAYIQTATEKINTLLIPTLEKLLGEGPFFLGPQMSAVDILVAKPLTNLEQLGLLVQSPSLQSLLLKISSLDSFEIAYSSILKLQSDRREPAPVPSNTNLMKHAKAKPHEILT